MISLVTLMWVLAFFFALIGFLRGWNKELVAMTAILLGMFAIIQFDPLLRGTIYLAMSDDQVFQTQALVLLLVVFIAFQVQVSGADDREEKDFQAGFLGAIAGAVNGYLIGGTLWYLLDINEYPMRQWFTAPGPNSASANSLDIMPLVLLNGGTTGVSDVLALLVIVLLFVVLVVI